MTHHRCISVPAVLVLVSALTQVTSAQQVPQPTPGVIRINVNLVQVDAVVVDARGKPVTNLKAEDFELLQDGKAQKIRNFEYVRVKDTLGSLVVRSTTLPSAGGPPVPPPPPAAPRPDQVRRTIAIVVDDIALSYDSTIQVRDSLKKWVNTEMQPGDLVSITRTNAAMGALQQFTNDKRMLFAAIDRLKFQPGRIGVASFTPFEPALPEGQTGPADTGFAAELANAYITGSLNAVRYVMQGLRDLPGRKSLIFFSEDLSLTSLDTQRQSIEERLRRLADQANRSSVVFYAIDPRGSIYTGPTASDNLGGREPAEIARMIGARSQQLITSQDGMVLLAQKTGGLFFSGSNDLLGPLSRAVDDGDGYYLMGYQPDQATFETKMNTPKYHSITLRVKRPGLKVRSRTGFFGMADSTPVSPAAQTPQAQIAKALVSPFMTADLRVRLTTLFSNSAKEGSYLSTLLHFDARDLTFGEAPDGTRTAVVDIAIVLFDANGDPIPSFNRTWTLRVRKENYDQILKEGLLYRATVPVKKSGPYQMRVALRDATSQKLGSAMQFIEVPDVKSGRLALSGIVLTADTSIPDDPGGSPALRIFKPATTVAYAYEVLNPYGDSSEKSPLQMQMRLYRDGETVYEGMPLALSPAEAGDATRFFAAGRLQLTKIPPGEYVMQIVVFDGARKDKARIATQTIDFEVRP
jgi:VWFA-related protein